MQSLNAQELMAAGRRIEAPFTVTVRREGRDQELVFTSVVRLLPAKRIVGVGVLNGREYLIKAYLGRACARYSRRERNGVALIVEAGVQTPELIWRASLADGRGEVLAFEYLKDAVSLDACWRNATSAEKQVEILTRAMVIIGKLHNHGVVQNDIHLANFLLSDQKLYTIDGGDIVKRSKPPLPQNASLRNLGMFFAQFYPRYDELVQLLLPAYEAVRGWKKDPARLLAVGVEIDMNRERRKRLCISKAFRECTRYVCNSSFRRFEVCERMACTPAMERLIDDPDAMIEKGVVLKNGNSATVALVHLDGRAIVIKRYNFKNAWHRVRRMFRRSRARHSWANACRMEFLGIPSVKPVALIENRFGPIRGRAYFITEYVEGVDAFEWLHSIKNPNGELEALSSILHELSDSRISHGDLKATNFVMSPDGPVILDLDAMREHKSSESFQRAFKRDLDRFMKNWQDRPELMERFDGLLGNITP